jgi:hypothetical protein
VEAAVLDQDLVDKALRMHQACTVKEEMVETQTLFFFLEEQLEIMVL